MSRQNIPGKIKRAAFLRADGHCEACGINLRCKPINYEYDHDIADALGGKATLENTKLLCAPCHRTKTGEHDMPLIAKGRRIRDRAMGIDKPRRTIPGRSFDGTPRPSRWINTGRRTGRGD